MARQIHIPLIDAVLAAGDRSGARGVVAIHHRLEQEAHLGDAELGPPHGLGSPRGAVASGHGRRAARRREDAPETRPLPPERR